VADYATEILKAVGAGPLSWRAIYFWFRDQGIVVAGALALIAGAAVYRAGILQARATREAAEAQKNTLDSQVNAAREAAEEAERRARRDLAYLLSNEAARIKMEAQLRYRMMEPRFHEDQRAIIDPEMREPYKILPRSILFEGQNMPDLLATETCSAVVALLASVDQMNVQLEIRTQLGDFHLVEFMDALHKVCDRADRAVAQLGNET
jgi:hypothetical protein